MKPLQVVKAMSYPRGGGYQTRHMVPGDVFTAATERDHKLLLATKKVREVREPADVPPPPPTLARKIAAAVAPASSPAPASRPLPATLPATPPALDERAVLRAEYEAKLGKKPFLGWSADELRAKMAEAPAADGA